MYINIEFFHPHDFNNNQYDNPVRYDSQILISINNQRINKYLVSFTHGNEGE